MLRSITIDDQDGNPVTIHDEGGPRQASKVTGLLGVGSPRDSRRVRPQGHGGIDDTRYEDGRLISIDGEVCRPGDVAGAIAEFRAVAAPMVQTWDVAPALLKWQEGPNAPVTNLVPYGDCEADAATIATYFEAANSTGVTVNQAPIQSSGWAASGSFSVYTKMTNPDATTRTIGFRTDNGLPFAAAPGRTYLVRVRGHSVSTPVGAVLIGPVFIDGSGVTVSGGSVTASVPVANGSDWDYAGLWVAPAGTVGAYIRVVCTATLAAQVFEVYADNWMFADSAVDTGYHNGDSENAEWTGKPHASTSVRYPGKQRLVKLASDLDPEISEAAALLDYQAQFFAEDPRAYSQVLMTVSSGGLNSGAGGLLAPFTAPILASQSAAGIVTLDNAGNRPTPPVFRIYGYINAPQIVHIGTGEKIVLTGTIPAGSYLDLDVQARTVMMNGATPQLGFLDAANTTWREASPGTSQWQLIASDFDTGARVDVLARSAYA